MTGGIEPQVKAPNPYVLIYSCALPPRTRPNGDDYTRKSVRHGCILIFARLTFRLTADGQRVHGKQVKKTGRYIPPRASPSPDPSQASDTMAQGRRPSPARGAVSSLTVPQKPLPQLLLQQRQLPVDSTTFPNVVAPMTSTPIASAASSSPYAQPFVNASHSQPYVPQPSVGPQLPASASLSWGTLHATHGGPYYGQPFDAGQAAFGGSSGHSGYSQQQFMSAGNAQMPMNFNWTEAGVDHSQMWTGDYSYYGSSGTSSGQAWTANNGYNGGSGQPGYHNGGGGSGQRGGY